PILQHRHFMSGADVHAELAEARGLDRPQPLDELRARAGEREGANDVSRDGVLLLRAQEHQMAAVIRKVTRIRWLILAVDFTISVELGLELRRGGEADRAELLLLRVVVKDDGRGGGRPRPRARGGWRRSPGAHPAAPARR